MSGAMIGLLWQWESLWIVALCAALLMLVSLMDDIFGLSVKWRFLVHSVAVAGFLGIALGTHWGFVGMAMLFVAMVWMINLYNFMDGSDGLAGGMALIGFGFYGLAAYLHGNDSLSFVSGSIAASAWHSCCSTFTRRRCLWVMQARFRSGSWLRHWGLSAGERGYGRPGFRG